MKKSTIVSIIGIFVLCAIGIPFVVGLLYKCEAIQLFWDPPELLTYIGAIFAAMCTFLGVFFSVQYAQSNYKEDTRNRVLPFLIPEMINFQKASEQYSENGIISNSDYVSTFFCIIDGNVTEYIGTPPENLSKLIVNNMFKTSTDANGLIITEPSRNLYVPFEIENCGNGVAVELVISISKCNVPEGDRKNRFVASLKQGQTIRLDLFSGDIPKECGSQVKYDLTIIYKDMYGNKYKQNSLLTAEWSGRALDPIIMLDEGIAQKLVSK